MKRADQLRAAMLLLTAAVSLITSSAVLGADILVPGEYPTIQAAIDAADDGDTIIASPNTYYENVDFGNKEVTLTSTNPDDPNVVAATIIDANGSGTVVVFPDDEDASCILTGFVITGGDTSADGGGISCPNGGAITITNCTIAGNTTSENGGGLYSRADPLTLIKCTFSGNSASDRGGGVFCLQGSLTLSDCTFTGNWTALGDGGGMFTKYGKLVLTDCTFSDNAAGNNGGGIGCDYNDVALTNCTFTGNSADHLGGAMFTSHYGTTATNCTFSSNSAERGGAICTRRLEDGDMILSNCTFNANTAEEYGGALYNWYWGNHFLTNCILWGNSAIEGPQIALVADGNASVDYCCVQGGLWNIYPGAGAVIDWGSSNIDADPCFADQAGGDYHLQSTAGRWYANTTSWVIDDNDSPCIDAGDPNSDWTAELWPHGKRINMGAFGGTAQASMSTSTAGNIANLDRSDAVDGVDLRLITDTWLYQQVLLSEDLNRDGLVNGGDFAIFADNWAWKE
jgi:predicted outer membrane repeat protein